MEKIIRRENGRRLRHTYEEMTPEKRPQDVQYYIDHPVSRRDGLGFSYSPKEHAYDGCPEVIVIRDFFGREATYVVEDRFSDTSRRPQSHDIIGRDLRFEVVEHGRCSPDDLVT
jgi:hypothetical protein